MAGEFWLDDRQWARLQPMLPNKPRGVQRVDDRRLKLQSHLRISAIAKSESLPRLPQGSFQPRAVAGDGTASVDLAYERIAFEERANPSQN